MKCFFEIQFKMRITRCAFDRQFLFTCHNFKAKTLQIAAILKVLLFRSNNTVRYILAFHKCINAVLTERKMFVLCGFLLHIFLGKLLGLHYFSIHRN